GRRALERVAVALVDEERLGAVDDAVGADDATQVGEERGPHHVAFLLAPAFRRVQRERERGARRLLVRLISMRLIRRMYRTYEEGTAHKGHGQEEDLQPGRGHDRTGPPPVQREDGHRGDPDGPAQ